MRIYNFFVRMVKKKFTTHVPLFFSAVKVFFVLHCCVKQRTFSFDELTTENIHDEKSYPVTLTHVASLHKFIE